MKQFLSTHRRAVTIILLIALALVVTYVVRRGGLLTGALINDTTINGQAVRIATLENHGETVTIPSGVIGMVRCPLTQPPVGEQWRTPADFSSVSGIRLYEYSNIGFPEREKTAFAPDRYNGKSFGYGNDNLTALAAGKMYQVKANATFTFGCSGVQGSSSSSSTSSPASSSSSSFSFSFSSDPSSSSSSFSTSSSAPSSSSSPAFFCLLDTECNDNDPNTIDTCEQTINGDIITYFCLNTPISSSSSSQLSSSSSSVALLQVCGDGICSANEATCCECTTDCGTSCVPDPGAACEPNDLETGWAWDPACGTTPTGVQCDDGWICCGDGNWACSTFDSCETNSACAGAPMLNVWCPGGWSCCESLGIYVCNDVSTSGVPSETPPECPDCEISDSCFCEGNSCDAGFSCVPGGTCLANTNLPSCPFIYAWNGSKMELDHEAIPFSFFKDLEETTYGTITSLVPKEDKLVLRITEERQEISNIDSFTVVAVDHDPAVRVIPDIHGDLHTFENTLPATECITSEGDDCVSDIAAKDENIVSIDPEDINTRSPDDLTHWVTLAFPKPENANGTAKLLLNVEADKLMTYSSVHYASALGDKGLGVLDMVLSTVARGAFQKSMDTGKLYMHIEVWNGKEWEKRDILKPGDYRGWDDFVVPLDLSGIEGNTVKVRLTSVGLYVYNYAGLDWSDDQRLSVKKIPIESAVLLDGTDASSLLATSDGERLVLHQDQQVDLELVAPPAPQEGKKRSYVFSLRGYYTAVADPGYESLSESLRLLRYFFDTKNGMHLGMKYYLEQAGEIE